MPLGAERTISQLRIFLTGGQPLALPYAGCDEVVQHNLPLQLTSFVGREQELADATRLLADTRLLTLTGAGGVGKTRLAIQLAIQELDNYPHGAWLVELAGLANPTLVLQSIAAALGVHEDSERVVVDSLTDFLTDRELLLVLDNCEHLLVACASVAERLLLAAPKLRILATSREALGILGEVAWLVPSLAITPTAEGTLAEAVRLFVDRARAVQPLMSVTADNAGVLYDICQQLDGIPLAIELAAARARSLSVKQIAERLADRFSLLTGGSRTAVPRHQTLRALVDWSYELLSEPERILLRRLSVFAGGWNLEEAEAICAGDGLAAGAILDVLSQLVDKSLVLAEEQRGAMRYRLLETLRRYCGERLAGAEGELLRDRHLEYFADFAARIDPLLYGPDQADWYDRLEVDVGNLRAALDWSESRPEQIEAGLRLGGSLWRFWFNRGHLTEGWERLARLLAVAAPEQVSRSSARALALNAAGRLGAFRCNLQQALAFLQEALTLYHQLGDQDGEAVALRNIGIVRMYGGDLAGADGALDGAIELMRGLGDRALTHTPLLHRGWAAYFQADYAGAERFWQEALEYARRYGDSFTIANILTGLGYLGLRLEDVSAAHRYFEQALVTHVGIGKLELGAGGRTSEALEGLACVAAAEGQFERALRLDGGAAALRRATTALLSGVRQSDIEAYIDFARKAVGPRASSIRAEGAAMSLEELVDVAVAKPAEADKRASPSAPDDGLTAREREIVGLVTEGLTNRQIADRLIIAERTAETHVQHILNKLGFTSRAQVAAWAVRQGLLTPAG